MPKHKIPNPRGPVTIEPVAAREFPDLWPESIAIDGRGGRFRIVATLRPYNHDAGELAPKQFDAIEATIPDVDLYGEHYPRVARLKAELTEVLALLLTAPDPTALVEAEQTLAMFDQILAAEKPDGMPAEMWEKQRDDFEAQREAAIAKRDEAAQILADNPIPELQ